MVFTGLVLHVFMYKLIYVRHINVQMSVRVAE